MHSTKREKLKQKLIAKIKYYQTIIKEGCGNMHCTNPYCKSNEPNRYKYRTDTQTSKLALSMVKSKHKQCKEFPEKPFIAKNGFPIKKRTERLEPIARILLIGVYDDDNILSNLRGTRFILKQIWELANEFNAIYWKRFIKTRLKGWEGNFSLCFYPTSITTYQKVHFPEPQDININMMPFIMSNTFKDTKLPSYTKPYFPMITKCAQLDDTQCGKIVFLTIQESLVHAGCTQRRPGLHVEVPSYTIGGTIKKIVYGGWGHGGLGAYQPRDGIYMASNVSGSTAIWNCRIVEDEEGKEAIGRIGDIEHLRSSLPGKQINMPSNDLWWITDRTPHEALPVEKDTYRQFFRLVTHKVSVWYTKHNTPNPNGVVPDGKITTIIKENKFETKDL